MIKYQTKTGSLDIVELDCYGSIDSENFKYFDSREDAKVFLLRSATQRVKDAIAVLKREVKFLKGVIDAS